MAKTFAYRDGHGHIYPPHPAMLAQPGLVPGHYDTETREFTPTGNPLVKTGNVITDAGFGGREKVLSGLGEDKGADTAPIGAGVVFTLPADQEAQDDARARAVELEQQLADEQERSRSLAAQVETLSAQLEQTAATRAPESDNADNGNGAGEVDANGQGDATKSDAPSGDAAPAPKRARKAS